MAAPSIIRTEGIVLKTSTYSEADLLVTYLTADLGLKTAFAKSPRKPKSRFGASLEPFVYARISLMGREDAPLPRLTQSDIVHPFGGLRQELRSFLMACEAAELVLRLLHEGERADGCTFELFVQMLHTLEDDPTALMGLMLKVRLLAHLGYAPRLSGCGRCGEGAVEFYASHGAMLCPACMRKMGYNMAAPRRMSPGGVRLFEALGAWELAKLKRLRAGAQMIEELNQVLKVHVEHLLQRPLNSQCFHLPARQRAL